MYLSDDSSFSLVSHGTIMTRQADGTVYQVAGAPDPDGAGGVILALTKDF